MTKVACVQLCSTSNVANNLEIVTAYIKEAVEAGAFYIQTPENTLLMLLDKGKMFAAISLPEYGQAIESLQALAKQYGVWLHIGSTAVMVGGDRAVNRSMLISPAGAVAAHYDKIHLFDVDLPGGESYRESDNYLAGDRAVVADIGLIRLGFSICYDLRFASLYRLLAENGANVIAAPSAFTAVTGRAHWRTLIKARAIETHSFVIAAAQGGRHDNDRRTYGHSLIVNPWGEIIGEMGESETGILVKDIDISEVTACRSQIPVLKNHARFRVNKLNTNQG